MPNPEVRQAYAQLLADNDFDTTQLLLGVSGNSKLLQDIGLKMGHSLRLAQMLLTFVDDTAPLKNKCVLLPEPYSHLKYSVAI